MIHHEDASRADVDGRSALPDPIADFRTRSPWAAASTAGDRREAADDDRPSPLVLLVVMMSPLVVLFWAAILWMCWKALQ